MKLSAISEGAVWKNPFPANRARMAMKGTSVCLGAGRIMHWMLIGSARLCADSRMMLAESSDYGRTWSEPAPIFDEGIYEPGQGGMGGNLMVHQDGTLWANICTAKVLLPTNTRWNVETAGWAGSRGFICRSTDEGRTWPDEQPIHAVVGLAVRAFSAAGRASAGGVQPPERPPGAAMLHQ